MDERKKRAVAFLHFCNDICPRISRLCRADDLQLAHVSAVSGIIECDAADVAHRRVFGRNLTAESFEFRAALLCTDGIGSFIQPARKYLLQKRLRQGILREKLDVQRDAVPFETA